MRLVYIRTQNPSEQLILERGPPLQLSIQMAAILNSAREVLNKFARLGAMLRAVDLSINDDIISSGPDDLEVSSRASISATYICILRSTLDFQGSMMGLVRYGL